ncbi:MAG: biopolymer transporter ExbD [Gemmataceae bacterium]|nr:biopolymer transporter ExbD [Gemmataceae bacterium]
MSHGGSEGSAEPNLTPLLDMVLQLVMFFMLVCNFTMENVNEDVKLPLAQSAKPADKAESEVLYLNLDSKGNLVVTGREQALTSLAEIGIYLRQQYKEAEEAARTKGDKSGDVKTVVIIRGHKDSDFAPVFNVLREAKQAGFKKWQLRATIVRNS